MTKPLPVKKNVANQKAIRAYISDMKHLVKGEGAFVEVDGAQHKVYDKSKDMVMTGSLSGVCNQVSDGDFWLHIGEKRINVTAKHKKIIK